MWTSLLVLNGCCDCSIVPGSLYPDMSPQDQKKDDAVFPGGNYTYTWTVPEDHSPTADDPNCLTWIYHSHIDAPKDIASGLIGPLLTCKKGKHSKRQQLKGCSSILWRFCGGLNKGRMRRYSSGQLPASQEKAA